MDRSVVFGGFKLERTFDAAVQDLYRLFSDQESKELWFKGPEGADTSHTMEFKVGGTEYNSGKFHDGIKHTFKGTYYDIVPNERIVYCYEMYLNDQRISVSVATLEFFAIKGSSKLILQESGAFLDGLDKSETRETGSKFLLEEIDKALKKLS